jgi:hypothetical protein
MTTPAPAPAPEPAPPVSEARGFISWLQEHVVPGVKDLEADAEKARKVLPLVEAYLPKITAAAEADPAIASAIAPLVKEAAEILAVIAGL